MEYYRLFIDTDTYKVGSEFFVWQEGFASQSFKTERSVLEWIGMHSFT